MIADASYSFTGHSQSAADAIFKAILSSDTDMASMISAQAELGCVWDINAALPTPRELVASWKNERGRWVA